MFLLSSVVVKDFALKEYFNLILVNFQEGYKKKVEFMNWTESCGNKFDTK